MIIYVLGSRVEGLWVCGFEGLWVYRFEGLKVRSFDRWKVPLFDGSKARSFGRSIIVKFLYLIVRRLGSFKFRLVDVFLILRFDSSLVYYFMVLRFYELSV